MLNLGMSIKNSMKNSGNNKVNAMRKSSEKKSGKTSKSNVGQKVDDGPICGMRIHSLFVIFIFWAFALNAVSAASSCGRRQEVQTQINSLAKERKGLDKACKQEKKGLKKNFENYIKALESAAEVKVKLLKEVYKKDPAKAMEEIERMALIARENGYYKMKEE